MARALEVVISIALVAASTKARAEEPAPRALGDATTVHSSSDCLTREAILEHTAAWLREPLLDPRIRVEVEVRGGVAGFVVRRDEVVAASRTFERLPSRCEDARSALALAMALAIDSTVLETLGIPSPAREGAAAEETPPPQSRPATVVPAPRVEGRLGERGERGSLGLAAGPLISILPGTVLAASLSLELTLWDDLVLRMSALGSLVSESALDRGRLEVSLAAFGVDLCPFPEEEGLPIRICGGVVGGPLYARGEGHAEARSTILPWVALRARADARLRLGARAFIELGAELYVPLVEARFEVYEVDGSVAASHTLSSVGAWFGLGAGMRWR